MKLIRILLPLLLANSVHAQINAYARVSSINSTTLTISSGTETYASFSSGQQVIVIQIQDNVIGTNTADNASFGALYTIGSAGMYEVATVASVSRSSGNLTQIVLNSALLKPFNTGNNSSVQVVSFPLLGNDDYTTPSNISALPWNGEYGGVIALRVNGKLFVRHNITADYAGFRGGAANSGNAGNCETNTFRIAANELNANKGEGIYKSANASFAAGRGRLLNGGGGGNSHNGGGGGGAHLTAGGEGGKGYQCSVAAGGLGGIALGDFINPDKVFMGGGGGAGEGNNSYNTAGGNGGGIIIIKADEIATSGGSGSAVRISANGQTPVNVGNDGSGGAGAAGSIILDVKTWNIASTRPLQIASNGGSGGNVTDGNAHGGGGGGSQGNIYYSSPLPTSNVTATTLLGRGGRNYAGGTYASNADGIDNQGVGLGSFAVLPFRLIHFKAARKNNAVVLDWKAHNKSSINRFEIQRSVDGAVFNTIGSVGANAADPSGYLYTFSDQMLSVEGTCYYRLKIVDQEEQQQLSDVVFVRLKEGIEITAGLRPNPINANARLNISSSENAVATIQLINMYGLLMSSQIVAINKGDNTVLLSNLGKLLSGTYHVHIQIKQTTTVVKMLVQK